MKTVVVTGAGGFIGGFLVRRLLDEGFDVRAADIKPRSMWYQVHDEANSCFSYDVGNRDLASTLLDGADDCYHLAADMGGLGFIASNEVGPAHSIDITSALLMAGHVERFFFSSSACVYPEYRQLTEVVSLKEDDAYPADCDMVYGWEKLYGEQLLHAHRNERGLKTRIARFHNIMGPHGTWDGGREKAPAAICRKVAQAKLSGDHRIEIWGDGEQTRSFLYIDECIEGIRRIMESDYSDPLNLGSDECVSINQLVSMVEEIAGIELVREYNLNAPQGVRGRNSDNSRISEVLGWSPSAKLFDGLKETYAWVYQQVSAS